MKGLCRDIIIMNQNRESLWTLYFLVHYLHLNYVENGTEVQISNEKVLALFPQTARKFVRIYAP